MATINNRPCLFTDDQGRKRTGIISGWREGSQWIKVTTTDGVDSGGEYMLHESEPITLIYPES